MLKELFRKFFPTKKVYYFVTKTSHHKGKFEIIARTENEAWRYLGMTTDKYFPNDSMIVTDLVKVEELE